MDYFVQDGVGDGLFWWRWWTFLI